MIAKQVTEILKKEGLLTKKTLVKLRDFERQSEGNVLDFCALEGIASTPEIIQLLQQTYHVPVIDLLNADISMDTARLLPESVCFEHVIIPFMEDESHVYCAIDNHDVKDLQRYIAQVIGKEPVFYLAQKSAILELLQTVFTATPDEHKSRIQRLIDRSKDLTSRPDAADEVPIISLVNQLLLYAMNAGASDMHIEAEHDHVSIRLRVDGILHEAFSAPSTLHAALIARVKILSKLRIDEHARPQDGRFSYTDPDYNVAVRVSIIPTLYGQKAALRFLNTQDKSVTLDKIGLAEEDKRRLEEVLRQPHGLLLITGPTGSGKTTTLYAIINALKDRKINISTIEDPVEYHIDGVNQMQVNSVVGLTFAEGLKSLLRQDPDVIMVGEIRDKETARIAINAALTGHLVISTIHTNTASAAIPRLVDMGIEPFLIASTVRCIINQRLIRVVCPHYKERMQKTTIIPNPRKSTQRSSPTLVYQEGTGCQACLNTGYKGRTGIFELMPIRDSFHPLIMEKRPSIDFAAHAKSLGMQDLASDGAVKVSQGITTPQEIARVQL